MRGRRSDGVVRLLSITHLQKRFGDRVAVDDVSFEVRSGETVGLLGPNGAGKTTTLSMMSGISKPDGGSVSFLGQRVHQDANALKKRVGLVPQDLALYEELSAWANLELFGGLYGLSGAALATRAMEALNLVGLANRRRDRQQRLRGRFERGADRGRHGDPQDLPRERPRDGPIRSALDLDLDGALPLHRGARARFR